MDLTSRLASSSKPRRARFARTVEWKIEYPYGRGLEVEGGPMKVRFHIK